VTRPDVRRDRSGRIQHVILVGLLLGAPAVLLVQSHFARLYPAALIVGLVAGVRARRPVQLALVAAAVASGPILWHLATPGTAAEALTALVDTSLLAALDYVREFVLDRTPLRAWVLLAFMVLLGLALAALFLARRPPPSRAPAVATIVSLGAAALAAATPRVLDRAREVRDAADEANRVRRAETRLLHAAASGSARLQDQPLAKRRDLTVVLYIGESATRWNWSLYGYPRQTNAPLAPHAASERFLTVGNAVSADAHPSSAPGIRVSTLSFLQRRTVRGPVSLSGVLARAGVATEWMANPARTGRNGRFYDHDLLPELRAALRRPGPGRLLVVEAYAGHVAYCPNVPRGRLVHWNDWIARLSDQAVWGRVARTGRRWTATTQPCTTCPPTFGTCCSRWTRRPGRPW
jgi:hypothetical protein